MAIVTNTFLTFSAIGNREDLANTISNISPENTPFMSNIGKGKASATLTEWQTDALAAAAANAQLQGDEMTFTAVTPTVRVGNRTMISRKTVVVSGTQDAVDSAGRARELSYQMVKMSKELKRDMEYNIIGVNQGGVTGDSTTAPKTASLTAWIKTNVAKASGTGANPDWTSGVPAAANVRSDGTVRAFTETILKAALSLCFTAGAEPSILMTGPYNKGVVSSFSGIATRFRDVSAGKQAQIIGAADVYVGDFGELKVVPNRFQRERDAWILDPKMAAVLFLRPFQSIDLAKTGDAEKKAILAEYALKVSNEAAHGLCADLATS